MMILSTKHQFFLFEIGCEMMQKFMCKYLVIREIICIFAYEFTKKKGGIYD